MDNQNVLTLTGDLDSLNKDMADWQLMSFDMRKRSDDACIEKYGRNNTELYELLKTNIELSNKTVEESASEEEFNNKLDRINQANYLMYSTGVVIINPWIIDDEPDYDVEYLTKTYNKYLGLFGDFRTQSDMDSQRLWGYNVHDMYQIMMSKLKDIADQKADRLSNRVNIARLDHSLREQSKIVESVCLGEDMLSKAMAKLDCLSACTESSIYEKAKLESLISNIDKRSCVDYSDDIPEVTPWFTPDEYKNLKNVEVDPYQYIFGKDQKILHDDIMEAMYNLSVSCNDEAKTEAVLDLGWNPNVQYTPEAIAYARQKQINWFNKNKPVEVVDISEWVVNESSSKKPNKVKLEPVYIILIKHDGITNRVIRAYTNSKYSHAGISLDEKMDNIYSFNQMGTNGAGFSVESLKFYEGAVNCEIRVSAIFVDPDTKKEIKKAIKYYKDNAKKTSYDISDLFMIVLNRKKDSNMSLSMICSQFTDSILKSAHINMTNKPSNLVIPADFTRPNLPEKVFVLYDGPIERYKADKVKNKVDRLLNSDLNPYGLSFTPVMEAVNNIFTLRNLDNFYVNTDNKEVNESLEYIRDLLTPTPAIVREAKQLPVRFNKKGDMYLDMPRNLEQEYQEAHRLLTSYDASNIQGIKHQLARLFYLNSIIETKIKKKKKDDEEYKQLVDLRARVLNDFKKYMKLVQKIEPNFDFEEYLKNSEYYNKTVKIDNSTLKYSGKVIKKFASMV